MSWSPPPMPLAARTTSRSWFWSAGRARYSPQPLLRACFQLDRFAAAGAEALEHAPPRLAAELFAQRQHALRQRLGLGSANNDVGAAFEYLLEPDANARSLSLGHFAQSVQQGRRDCIGNLP